MTFLEIRNKTWILKKKKKKQEKNNKKKKTPTKNDKINQNEERKKKKKDVTQSTSFVNVLCVSFSIEEKLLKCD